MRPQTLFWWIGFGAALLAGCATRRPGVVILGETRQAGVKILEETRIAGVDIIGETPIIVPEENEPAAGPETEEFEVVDLLPEVTPEETPDPRLSRKKALDHALDKTIEGLRQYRSGAIEAAHESLTRAHFMFLEAGLSEPLAARGLNLFQEFLPSDLQFHDPEAIRQHLDRTDQPEGIEGMERATVDRGVRRFLREFGDLPEGDRLEELIVATHYSINIFQGRGGGSSKAPTGSSPNTGR